MLAHDPRQLKHRDLRFAKDFKKLVPEAFGVRLLAFDVLPVLRERAGAVGNFFPVQGPGESLLKKKDDLNARWHGSDQIVMKQRHGERRVTMDWAPNDAF